MPANKSRRDSRDSSPELKRNASMTSSRSKNSSHSGGHSHAPGSPKTTSSSRRGRERSRSRARTSSRSPSRDRRGRESSGSGGGGGNRERSKSRARSKSRSRGGGGIKIEKYDTPFDPKGRCHYHSGVQLAKKKLTGGWKVSVERYEKRKMNCVFVCCILIYYFVGELFML